MTDNTAKNLVGRNLINLRVALQSARPYIADLAEVDTAASALLARIDTLIYRHADPEMDLAKRWAAGNYEAYPELSL